jgi:hypothetical protein
MLSRIFGSKKEEIDPGNIAWRKVPNCIEKGAKLHGERRQIAWRKAPNCIEKGAKLH